MTECVWDPLSFLSTCIAAILRLDFQAVSCYLLFGLVPPPTFLSAIEGNWFHIKVKLAMLWHRTLWVIGTTS